MKTKLFVIFLILCLILTSCNNGTEKETDINTENPIEFASNEDSTGVESKSESQSKSEDGSESETESVNENISETIMDGIKHVRIKHPVVGLEDENGYIELIYEDNDLPSTIRIVSLNEDGEEICAMLRMKNLKRLSFRLYTYYSKDETRNTRKFAIATEGHHNGSETFGESINAFVAYAGLIPQNIPGEKPFPFQSLSTHAEYIKEYVIGEGDYSDDNRQYQEFYNLLEFKMQKEIRLNQYNIDLILTVEDGQLITESQANINSYPRIPVKYAMEAGFGDDVNKAWQLGYPICNHEADEWVYTVEPSCGTIGKQAAICAHCGIKMVRNGEDGFRHSFVDSTCSVCGLDERACMDFVFKYRNDSFIIDQGLLSGSTAEEILLPAVYNTRPVTEIHEAFRNNQSIKRVIIPSGYTILGNSVFVGCTALESVSIPETVTKIGNATFSGCISLTSVDLPVGITDIGNNAFFKSGIESITIPEGTLTLGNSVLSGCNNLTEVTIPASVKSVGVSAFNGSPGLKKVVFEGADTTIGALGFMNCTSLESVTLPSNLRKLENGAFYDCVSLKSITLPASLEVLDSAFRGCTALTEIVIPDKITKIEEVTFQGCSSLISITFPAGITSINYNAFKGCTSLTEFIFPDGVKTVENYVLADCTSLERVVLGSSATEIAADAFANCASLKEITIPASVTAVDSTAFSGCTSLNAVYFGGSVEEWTKSIANTMKKQLPDGCTVYCADGDIVIGAE